MVVHVDAFAFVVFQQISVHLVFCLIAGVLSLHLTFIFLGKEAKAREIYKAKCQSQFKGSCTYTPEACIEVYCLVPRLGAVPCSSVEHVLPK